VVVLQRVLVEKGSGPACVPFWVEPDFLWVRRRRIRPRASIAMQWNRPEGN